MIGSSFMDPVLGVDVHFEMVPTPAPTPTPIPNPFIGVIFDPVGLAAGIAIGAAVGAVMGASFQGPVLYWTAFPATNTGTEAKGVPGHIIIPPGVAWAPFPKTPKPVIHPGEVPTPAAPIKPEDDAICIFGSKTVTVMGSNAVRLGDIALSCGEPVRLPSSVVLAVPKGAPILIGGPPSLDVMAAILGSLRTRFISDSLHAALSRLKPSRFRNFLNRAVCFFTGHPVDVASGKVMTDAVDLELPGPLPLRIERVYSSAFAARDGSLGHGWSLSVDQAVWRERGAVVLLAEDGREIEFDTFDFADHQIAPGQQVVNRVERLTLRCERDGAFVITDADGISRHFAPVAGRTDDRSMLQRITTRGEASEIRLSYDERGRLQWIRDCGGRTVGLSHDTSGRVVGLHAPNPGGEGLYKHRTYHYDARGDLTSVTDSLGATWTFEYASHLLTTETDRVGTSFYFLYDGMGEDARCIRTWGDDGIYDHVLGYDKRGNVTFVTNSRGDVTQYHTNIVGLVTKIVDPLGGETTYAYDPETLQRIEATAADGWSVQRGYDERGNLSSVRTSDGATLSIDFDPHNNPIKATDAVGGQWQWLFDRHGRLTTSIDSMGRTRRFARDGDLVSSIDGEVPVTLRLEYDAARNLTAVHTPDGALQRWDHDNLGRIVAEHDALGATTTHHQDTEGRVHKVQRRDGSTLERRYDAEGRVIAEHHDGVRRAYEYSGRGWLSVMREGDDVVQLRYDTEGLLTGVVNEAGLEYGLSLNECGEVASETDYAGHTRHYVRDAVGRIVKIRRPGDRFTDLSYDDAGRLASLTHHDGTRTEFSYRADGHLMAANNDAVPLSYERDLLGRVLSESQGETTVVSRYDGFGRRVGSETSRGSSREMQYAATGELSRMQHQWASTGRPWTANMVRDAAGSELRRELGTGAVVQWERDAAGRPVRQRAGSGEGVVFDRRFSWTREGWLSQVEDPEGGTTRYGRDARGRLNQVQHQDGEEIRSSDVTGNVFGRADHRDRRYGVMGRAEQVSAETGTIEYEYDDEGFLTRQSGPGADVWQLSWDGSGMLRSVTKPDGETLTFQYDALARRVRRSSASTTTDWAWDGNALCHEITDEADVAWVADDTAAAPMLRSTATESINVVCDHIGAPAALIDDSGQVRATMTVNAFGGLHRAQGDTALCPFRYPGQVAEPEGALVYNRFRYLDARLGHYISADPLRLTAGWHAYRYVPDPTRYIDPLGLDFMMRVQLQRGAANLASVAINSDVPITAVQVERAMLQMIDALPKGERGLIPMAHGAAASISKQIRGIVPTGISTGGNILRRWLGDTKVRFDVENRGHNLQACK